MLAIMSCEHVILHWPTWGRIARLDRSRPGALLKDLPHDPLVLLRRDGVQDYADGANRSSALPDDLADLSFANSEFVDERRLSSDLLDLNLIGLSTRRLAM